MLGAEGAFRAISPEALTDDDGEVRTGRRPTGSWMLPGRNQE